MRSSNVKYAHMVHIGRCVHLNRIERSTKQSRVWPLRPTRPVASLTPRDATRPRREIMSDRRSVDAGPSGGGGGGDDGADDARAGGVDLETCLPLWTKFLLELVPELREDAVRVREHAWRETEIVSSLTRRAIGGAGGGEGGGARVGRVFTAANERGCAALIGEELEDFESQGAGMTREDLAAEVSRRRGCRVAVSTLERDVNLGAVDGRNTKVVLLVTVPEDLHPHGALSDLTRIEALKTMKTAFLKLINETDFVKDVRTAKTVKDVIDGYVEAISVLTGEHIRRAEVEAEMASRRGAMYTGKFAGGIIDDVKRRLVHYKSDWSDALKAPTKCLSATLYMYFACLGPAIAFGGLAYKETTGMVGAMEYLASQALSGILWAIFAGQPEIVLRPAGPQTVFLIELFKRCKTWKIEFLPTFGWVGVWTAIFMLILACSDACAWVARKCTKFTQDIFSLFVCAIFIFEGMKNLIEYFTNDSYTTEAALFSLILGVMTLQIGLGAVQLRSSPYMNATIRELFADFGLASAVIIASVTANLAKIAGLENLQITNSFAPSMDRNWWLDLSAGDKYIPLIAILPAVMLTMLYFVDMNVATLLCNTPDMKMRKGAAYHYNFAVLAFLVLITSLLGLPPPTGSLPHSPQYVLALSDVEEYVVDGETRTKIIKVHEQRLSPLLVNVLVALSFVVIPVLKSIPLSVLFGLFIYTGIMGLYENHFWERIKIAFMEPRLHPPTSYVRHVPLSRVHAFTCVQIACVGVLWGIRSSPIALTFPLFIFALMPLRMFLLKRFNMFSSEWLELLDAKGTKAYDPDIDNQMMEDSKENKWLSNAKSQSGTSFMAMAESGPSFNMQALHARSRSEMHLDHSRGAFGLEAKTPMISPEKVNNPH